VNRPPSLGSHAHDPALTRKDARAIELADHWEMDALLAVGAAHAGSGLIRTAA